MKRCIADWRTILMVGTFVAAHWATVAWAQTAPDKKTSGRAAEERKACIRNLKTIYEAIQAFQDEHQNLPNWLSDLVPQYLPDANVLICPLCRRTGQTEAPPLADPKLPSSYLFEFCPVPLGNLATNVPNRTRRDWKRRQMGLVGSQVPLVRCRHHKPALNLAFDGRIYESPASWELLFTNRVNAAELTPARLFADEKPSATKGQAKAGSSSRFPPRDPKTRNELLNLTSFYNAGLNQSWSGIKGNDLGTLPKGIQKLAGVEFDVRGIIQLGSQSTFATNFPVWVKGIPVHQQCRRLHFLHAAAFGTPADEGKQIAAYVVHFGTNQPPIEIPIRYGLEVRDWHAVDGEPALPEDRIVAWRGTNAATRSSGESIRLFLTTWTNTAPERRVERIDYVSSMAGSAPFLIGISAD
jgi:hypothetical protein